MTAGRSLVAAIGLALGIWMAASWLIQPPCFAGSDFYAFWAAGRLGDHRMYDPAALQAVQQAECPQVRDKRFIRPAIQGLALYPLGRLPYRAAYAIWFVLNAAACLAVFRLRWRSPPSQILSAALYLPLVWNFGLGQDAPLLLLALAAGARLTSRGRQWSGGAVLALCLLKPNIFFAVPPALVLRRQWRAQCTLRRLPLSGSAGRHAFSRPRWTTKRSFHRIWWDWRGSSQRRGDPSRLISHSLPQVRGSRSCGRENRRWRPPCTRQRRRASSLAPAP